MVTAANYSKSSNSLARRLIVTAREARALRDGATQVRRLLRAQPAVVYQGIGYVPTDREPYVIGGPFGRVRHRPIAMPLGRGDAAVIDGAEWVVTGVRVERVQDATEEDARAMGVRPLPLQEGEPGCWYSADAATPNMHARDAIGALRKAWDAEHPRAPWAANPWVAVGVVRRMQ